MILALIRYRIDNPISGSVLNNKKCSPQESILSFVMDHLKTDNLQNGSNRVNTGNPLEEFGEDITSNSHCEETGISEEAATHPTSIQTECTDIDKLGQVFEHCIQEVSRLEMQRDLLIQEFLQLQEPMRQVVKHLRGRLFEAQRLLTLAQLDYIALYEDVQQVKRKLFATARACIQSQVTLAAHEYEVAQSDVTQVGMIYYSGYVLSIISIIKEVRLLLSSTNLLKTHCQCQGCF